MKTIIRYAYVPAILCGVNAAAIAVALSSASTTQTAVWIFGLAAIALIASFSAERALPYETRWNRSHNDVGRDVAHFIVNEGLSLGPLVIAPIFIAAAGPAPDPSPWPTHWPVVLQLALSLVVFDFAQYAFHWVSHRWEPLWRLHAIHHSVERMYGLNGIMKHPVYQVLASIVSVGPLAALGMPDAFAVVISFVTFTQLLVQHANVDLRTGPARRLLATAEVHRYHHLRGKEGDVNFGLIFAFWDELFGTAYAGRQKLGVGDIGVDYQDYPKGYVAQLVAPLRSFASLDRGTVK